MNATRKPRSLLVIVVLCLALTAMLIYGFRSKPLPVQTAFVTRGLMTVSVTEEGKTRIRSRHLVYPPTAGHLQRVDLRPGARVEAGKTVLAVLTPEASTFLNPRAKAEATARADAAQAAAFARLAEARRANASLELARAEFERMDKLLESEAVARQEWDRAESQMRVLERGAQAAAFALQVAKHEALAARAVLNRAEMPTNGESMSILAPVDGYVLAVMEENARAVIPSTPIMEVGDPSDLEIEIELLSTDAVAVAPGAHVRIEHWGGEGSLGARVTVVEPGGFTKVSAIGVEEQRVKVRAELIDALPPGLLLGDRYGVQARIEVWRGDNILQVPTGALFRRGGEWMTFVLEGGKAMLRKVAIGRENGLEAEVREGLAQGETVILHPPDTLKDGVRVRAEKP